MSAAIGSNEKTRSVYVNESPKLSHSFNINHFYLIRWRYDDCAVFIGKMKMVEMIFIMNLQKVIKQLMIWTSFLPAIVANHLRSSSVSLLTHSHL